jgi:hypothetical protein
MTTLNGNPEPFAPPPTGSAAECLLEAWRETLGDILNEERREWQRERALIEAQAGRTIAELRTEVVSLRGEINNVVAAAIANLRNGIDGSPGGGG